MVTPHTQPATPATAPAWTVETVEAFIALGATHRTARDQGQTYPVIEWADEGPNHLLDVLAYLETSDGHWRWYGEFVIGTPPTDDRRGWITAHDRGFQRVHGNTLADISPTLTEWLNEADNLPARHT